MESCLASYLLLLIAAKDGDSKVIGVWVSYELFFLGGGDWIRNGAGPHPLGLPPAWWASPPMFILCRVPDPCRSMQKVFWHFWCSAGSLFGPEGKVFGRVLRISDLPYILLCSPSVFVSRAKCSLCGNFPLLECFGGGGLRGEGRSIAPYKQFTIWDLYSFSGTLLAAAGLISSRVRQNPSWDRDDWRK